MPKPKPIAKHVVCSECGLSWEKHKERMKTSEAEPKPEDCIALLKAELAKRPAFAYAQSNSNGMSHYNLCATN
jgi:hypothetical protein